MILSANERVKFWTVYTDIVTDPDQNQRIGQAMMNALYTVAPDIYAEVSGTDADCFYQNKNIPAFKEHLGLDRVSKLG